MDNKALAELIRSELSKVHAAIDKLFLWLKSSAPREQNQKPPNPKDHTEQEGDRAIGQPGTPPKVNPSPTDTPKSEQGRYKTVEWWKPRLEVVALMFGIGYAIVTYCMWRDSNANFRVDQRAWIEAHGDTGER